MPTKTIIYRHIDNRTWGYGIVMNRLPDKLYMHFEDGKQRIIKDAAPYIEKLVAQDLPASEAEAIIDLITKGSTHAALGKAGDRPTKATPKHRVPTMLFQAQLDLFERVFPGGFLGEKFVAEERGKPGTPGIAGYKQAAIELAQTEFAKGRMAALSDAEVFDTAKTLLHLTNIPHPIEGAIPFRQMKEDGRKLFVDSLRDLLHGNDDYALRFNRYVDCFRLEDKEGRPKHVTWPVVTLFHAFLDPSQHLPVKLTFFRSEAAMFDIDLRHNGIPSATTYARCVEVGREVERKLLDVGHKPRDLMDIYSFIWRTLKARSQFPSPTVSPRCK
jgi:hypothetical protein